MDSDFQRQLLYRMGHHRMLSGPHSSPIYGDVWVVPYMALVLGSATLGTRTHDSILELGSKLIN